MIDLKDLGMTQEELQNRVVDKIANSLLHGTETDEDGEPYPVEGDFSKALNLKLHQKINEAVDAIATKHIHPKIEDYIRSVVFLGTNRWGEPKEEAMTFLEYLDKKAQSYMTEEVNWDGKTKEQSGRSYDFRAHGTRVVTLVEKHLNIEIERYMKNAMALANGQIVEGLEKAVKMKLGEIAAALKVKVEMPR